MNFQEYVLTPKFLIGVSVFISGFTFGSNWGRERIIILEPKKRCYVSQVDGSFNCLDWRDGRVLVKNNQYLPAFFKKSTNEDMYWIDWGNLNLENLLENGSEEYGDSLFQRLDILMKT